MGLFDQLVSLVGAALILAAFFGNQRGSMGRDDRRYNALNLAGSVLLTYSAYRSWNIGFMILEGSWALLSIPGTFRRTPRTD